MKEVESAAVQQQQQNALRILALLVVALLLPVPVYLYLAVQNGYWQSYALAGIALILSAVNGVALRQVLRGNHISGIWLSLIGIFVALPLAALFVAGLGMAGSLLVMLITLLVSSMTMPRKQILGSITTALPFIFIAATIDFFSPATQLDIAILQQLIWIVAAVLLAVYAIIIARQFQTYAIAAKLLLTFLVIALAPLTILLIATSLINRPALTQTANDRLNLAAVQTANNVDSFLMSNANAVRSEAQLPIIASYLSLPPDARANSVAETLALNTLRALKSKNEPFITSYALLNESGQVILDTQPPNMGQNESGRNHFRQPVADRLVSYISPLEFEEGGGAASLYFSSPIWGNDGVLLGVLRSRLNPIVLQQIVQQSVMLAGDESYPVLVDDNLLYLAHGQNRTAVYSLITDSETPPLQQLQSLRRLPPAPRVPRTQFAPDLAANLRQEGAHRFFTSDSLDNDGRTVQAAAVRLSSIPSWQVVVYQPQAIFTAPVTAQLNASLLLAAVIAAVAAVTAFGVAQRLSEPLRQLTEGAQRAAAGDLGARIPVQSNDEIGLLAQAFNQMTTELTQTLSGLETRVAERTRALELTTEVSRRLSTILEQDKLVTAVVEQIKNKFNYYHVHIYLLDSDNKTLRMVGGTGEAGEAMLAANHSLPLGKGLVGRAAANETTLLVADVSRDPNWLANSLLPDTKAELAVPIILGDKLLGVIDVQQDKTEGLNDDDARLIQAIALQVAIGLQNAQAFAQAQRQAEREALLNSISQQIQGSATMEMALQVAAREVGRALGVEQTMIRLRTTDLSDPSSNGE